MGAAHSLLRFLTINSGTLSPDSSSEIPTVTDNLDADTLIPTDLVAVSFEPTTTSPNTNGELTWGLFLTQTFESQTDQLR